MADLLQHRGPDSGGEMRSEAAVIGVQRLRIVDLNTRADQPFSAIEDQVWLACNGEIYNSTAIRARHQGYPFRSDSDVEPILPLYLDEGPRAIAQLDGMFAVAIWDSRQNTLVLARDRAGEKPLFVAQVGDEIWFSSEIASLLRNPDVDRTFDLDALGDYLRLGYVLQPRTMFRGVRRIEAGTIVTFRQDGSVVDAYWQPAAIPIRSISERDAEEAVQAALDAAVERQIRADVPVGVFSSGGLDSSLLVQLSLEKLGLDRVRSFSLRFPRHSYDESPYAEKFAAERSIPHVTVTADDESLLAILPTIIDRVAEPIADPAMLATALLSRTARETVTVVLTGEGADELFGGYPTYLGHRMAQRLGHVPAPLRNAITRMVGLIPSSSEKVTIEYLLKRFMDGIGEEPLSRHVRWFGTGLPPEITSRPFADAEVLRRELRGGANPTLADFMLFDYRTYLRDNLLVKIDRTTMLSSVESRAPYLDHALTELALSLPDHLRVRGLTGKRVLKKAAERWLPKSTIYRRKRGLSLPVAEWMNGRLRGDVDRLLDQDYIRKQGLMNPALVTKVLAEHRSGKINHGRALWALYILQLWLERWMPGG